MKKIFFAVLVLALVFSFSAEATSPLGMNGYDWQEMNETEREKMVKGVIVGLNTFTLGMAYEFEKEEDPEVELEEIIEELNEIGDLLAEEEFNLVLNAVNEYYQNEDNLENSFTQAFYIASKEVENIE